MPWLKTFYGVLAEAECHSFQASSGVPKPNNLRKKWRKSAAIQLVPTTPAPTVSQPQQNDIFVGLEQPKANGESDVPLKLPRAMRSTLTNKNQQLKERNSDTPNDNDIETSHQHTKTRDGKENKDM